MTPRKALISGASIAGPVCAYWLNRAGFDVTLVERSSAPRQGGYAIDIRGPAVTILDRMGVLPNIRKHQFNMQNMAFVDKHGRTVANIVMSDISGTEDGLDVEVRRGTLSNELFGATGDKVDYRFNDSISGLSQDNDGVDVEFASGTSERFDIVVAADGLHSGTRAKVFGSEQPLHRYMGYFFGLFTMPNIWRLGGEARVFSDVGRAAALYGVDANESISALLTVTVQEPPFNLVGDPVAQRAFLARSFADVGGLVPEILKGLENCDDLFCDMISQIRSPQWSRGRVALIGDAAAAPSFMTGQGTSLAIIQGYMLAQALAQHADHKEAFAAYERGCRPFTERNQRLAKPGGWILIPKNRLSAMFRIGKLRMMPLVRRFMVPGAHLQAVHNSLALPDFPDRSPA